MSLEIKPASDQQLSKAAELLSALAYPGRLRIMWLLAEHGQQSVGQMGNMLLMDQSTLSHQLRILRQAKLVKTTRQGRHIFYQIADQHVLHIIHDAIVHANEAQHA